MYCMNRDSWQQSVFQLEPIEQLSGPHHFGSLR